ncbi:MAG: VOC family protein [Pseudomonadota bacterium]
MITYMTVGTDDMARSKRFYSAFLPALGYELTESPEGLNCILPKPTGQSAAQPELYIVPPFDGAPATAGNGAMIGFNAKNQQQVRELYAAALAAGGTDEGPPGFRDAYGDRFYVGYLRDPYGNKLAIYSNNPDEPGRNG